MSVFVSIYLPIVITIVLSIIVGLLTIIGWFFRNYVNDNKETCTKMQQNMEKLFVMWEKLAQDYAYLRGAHDNCSACGKQMEK